MNLPKKNEPAPRKIFQAKLKNLSTATCTTPTSISINHYIAAAPLWHPGSRSSRCRSEDTRLRPFFPRSMMGVSLQMFIETTKIHMEVLLAQYLWKHVGKVCSVLFLGGKMWERSKLHIHVDHVKSPWNWRVESAMSRVESTDPFSWNSSFWLHTLGSLQSRIPTCAFYELVFWTGVFHISPGPKVLKSWRFWLS